jgi:lipoprotein-anchoring transpeptidase ErfK/SrfK
LTRLNPGVNINQLKAGDKLIVPTVIPPRELPPAGRVEINLSEKVIRVIGTDKQLIAMFHCSVAAKRSSMPTGEARVTVIVPDPEYRFDPVKWPEVKENITKVLIIPPGPRNPVGRCWIGLSKAGYGMHGTPNPELIGKTGSHGCIRLTNWDAIRLSKTAKLGTPVKFVGHPTRNVARR